jgi:predicted HTH transcriptional regulator
LGTVEFEQANITKNQIRYALLDLLRDIETQDSKPEINIEIESFLSKQPFTNENAKKTEYDIFLTDIKKHQHNQFSATSERLIGKTVDMLDIKQVKKLFSQTLAKEHFKQYKIKKTEELGVKLKALQLITNGYVIKGTFMCLASIDNVRSVTRVAYESRFFTFRDLKAMNTKVVKLVAGNLIQQFEQIIDHIMNNMYIHRDLDTRTDDYEIPEKVFTELLANAFIHSNYADDAITGIKVEIFPDRMVFYNPGVIQEDILQNLENNKLSYIVNPEIVKLFFLHKIIETAGRGIARVQEILKNSGMLPAQIEQKAGYVIVTVFKYKKPYFDPVLELEKAFQLIEKEDVPNYFALLEPYLPLDVQDTFVSLKKQFINGASDASFFAKLKVFATLVFENKTGKPV